MEKLIIAGRNNGKSSFYIKFKAQEKSMSIIKKIVQDLGSKYFVDNQVLPRSMKFDKWKDQWIPIHENGVDIDIICGDKMIHMLVDNCPNFDKINIILNKYCEWAQPKYKKGFSPRPDSI